METVTGTPRLGHAPIPMRRVADHDAMDRVGDFAWGEDGAGTRYIRFAEPNPSKPEDPSSWVFVEIPVVAGEHVPGKWGWDGNEERPTLHPSVHTRGIWHGWIQDGKLVEA